MLDSISVGGCVWFFWTQAGNAGKIVMLASTVQDDCSCSVVIILSVGVPPLVFQALHMYRFVVIPTTPCKLGRFFLGEGEMASATAVLRQ